MNVVIDSNVLISSLLFTGKSRTAYDYCIEHCDLFISDFILTEVTEKLREKFSVGDEMIKRIVTELQKVFQKSVPRTSVPNICRDADDNFILQLCESVAADFLITGDKDLLVLKQFESARIISPANFLRAMESTS